MSSFDVWVVRFEPGNASPADRLQSAFGMDAARARSLEQSLPKIVKHAVPAKVAGEMRQALESIGAVVECRQAKPRPAAATAGTDVIRAPDVDLLPAGRMSAIDPFAPATDASVPRISVDDAVPPAPPPKATAPPVQGASQRVTSSLLAASLAQQRTRFVKRAIGTIVAGGAILAIGWFFGGSVLRGQADWIGIGFDGLGIYFIGVGIVDLVTTLRG